MKTNYFRYSIGIVIGIILFAGCFSGGVIAGWAMPPSNGTYSSSDNPFPMNLIQRIGGGSPPPANTVKSREDLYKPYWRAVDIVHDQYVDQPVDDEKLMQGAIRGMMESLGDPHTSYMDPNQFRQMNIHQEGEYEGIGAWVDITGEFLKIISPMPGSPAEKAGLKAGDLVIAIDGKDMTGIDGNLVLQNILGPAGTKVKLTIRRANEPKPIEVEIQRSKIAIPSVEGKMLDNHVAYVHIYNFGDKTTNELRENLTKLLADKPVGLVVDLRNNGGGYLNTSIEVLSEFFENGTVVMYEQFGDGKRNTFKTSSGGLATTIPIVVLVNEGTASASEITAGAIQDYGRGRLVGVKTYGKGSVQNVIRLPDEEGAVRVTIARWLTPKERLIHKKGLMPDFEVQLTEEDAKAKRDPQLDKAVELLTTK